MASFLSSISGKFSKSLILGTFLPVAIFIILAILVITPLVPSNGNWWLLRPLGEPDNGEPAREWKVATISFIAIVLSGLLYNLNTPIIRFFEGYPWRNGWLGQWRTQHYTRLFDGNQARQVGMDVLLDVLPTNDPRYAGVLRAWGNARRRTNNEFPMRRYAVLPTRLGNIIRSFEQYPQRQYGIEAITLWPRLVAKVDKDYAATIDDAKSSFDFMINCCVLSAVLALGLAAIGLWQLFPLTSVRVWGPWLLEIVAFIALSRFFYLRSISPANEWGATVKAAFDLYRWDLLKQLGYKQLPATKQAEHELWLDISRQLMYADPPNLAKPDYNPSTFAQGKPRDVTLEITRGIKRDQADSTINVVLLVRNTDEKRAVTDVVVRDTPPDGFSYVWDSASTNTPTRELRVVGTGSYRFYIRDLAPQAEVCLTYQAILCDKPQAGTERKERAKDRANERVVFRSE